MTGTPIVIARTRKVTYWEEQDQPIVDKTASLQENNQIQHAMTEPTTARLVHPFHNTIDLSTSEGKTFHKKTISGLPEAGKKTQAIQKTL